LVPILNNIEKDKDTASSFSLQKYV